MRYYILQRLKQREFGRAKFSAEGAADSNDNNARQHERYAQPKRAGARDIAHYSTIDKETEENAVQTCTVCSTSSQDEVQICPTCGSDLRESSATAVALKKLKDNPRVSMIRVQVMGDACPVCQEAMGAYSKESAPRLPIEGCSHRNGCRCFYAPALNEIFP
jgi:hypothetical protein